MSLPDYLSSDEYDDLDEFLVVKAEPAGGIPGLSWLDGYLAAIALSPEQIDAEEWLPLVWTAGDEDVSPFEDEAELKAVTDKVMRHYEGIEQCLRRDPLQFRPILLEDQDDPELPDLTGWASGFMDGLALRPELWQELIDSPDNRLLLLPIFLYGTDAGEEEMLKEPDFNDPLFMAEELPHTIKAIRDFWEERG